jgi:hypothetical protein
LIAPDGSAECTIEGLSRILRRSGECSTPILAIGADAALTHFRWVLARRIEAEGKTARAA